MLMVILKKQFKRLSLDRDIPKTTVFNLSTKKGTPKHCAPFEIDNDIPNKLTEKAIKDARNGVGLSKSFSSVKELMNDLNADKFENSLKEIQEWAASVGYKEDDVDDIIKSIRIDKHK